MNKNMTYKDMNNIKGGLRRAFARSDHYQKVKAKYRVEHFDPKHPRCSKWSYCAVCGVVTPDWRTTLDHIDPLVPVNSHFEDIPINESINRLWCEESNLQNICDACHYVKSRLEAEMRKPYKKPRNKSNKPRRKRNK